MKQSFIGGLDVTLKDSNLGEIRVDQKGNVLNFSFPCPDNISCTPYVITFPIGIFFIEVVGGSGGFVMNGLDKYRGGYGGISEGVYKTNRNQRVYLFIGGSGENYIQTNDRNGGFNGGGKSYGLGGGGGGSTDIRLNEDLSTDSRIIVAGGGGGSRFPSYIGGNAGGESGETGQPADSNIPCYGSSNGCVGWDGDLISLGTKCRGGDGISTWGSGMGGGGGGSGYYGGGSAGNSAGSGGSGFFGNLINFENYSCGTYFSDHEGNGYAIITIIEITSPLPLCSLIPKYGVFNLLALSIPIIVSK